MPTWRYELSLVRLLRAKGRDWLPDFLFTRWYSTEGVHLINGRPFHQPPSGLIALLRGICLRIGHTAACSRFDSTIRPGKWTVKATSSSFSFFPSLPLIVCRSSLCRLNANIHRTVELPTRCTRAFLILLDVETFFKEAKNCSYSRRQRTELFESFPLGAGSPIS